MHLIFFSLHLESKILSNFYVRHHCSAVDKWINEIVVVFMTSNLLLWPWIGNSASVRFLVKNLSEIIVGLELLPSKVSVIKVFQSFKSLIALKNILLSLLDQLSLCPCLASIQLGKLRHFHRQIGKPGPIEVFLQRIDQLANRWLWFDEEHLKTAIYDEILTKSTSKRMFIYHKTLESKILLKLLPFPSIM